MLSLCSTMLLFLINEIEAYELNGVVLVAPRTNIFSIVSNNFLVLLSFNLSVLNFSKTFSRLVLINGNKRFKFLNASEVMSFSFII